LFDGSYDDVIRIHHFIEMHFRDFRQQLVGVQFGKSVVPMNPVHQFSKGDARRIIDGSIRADGHDRVVILKFRPLDSAPLDHTELNSRLEWNLDRRPGNFTIAHRGMSIPNVKKTAIHVYRKVHRVSHASFRRIHVPAELRRHHRTARLTVRGSYADAAEERMKWNL